jgi:hypothetical protein
MENLFQQVARIARRSRKRWLGLVFVTQLSQHLPDEVLALINNFVLHKITDANVISRLRRTAGGIDESLWDRLPSLAQGQSDRVDGQYDEADANCNRSDTVQITHDRIARAASKSQPFPRTCLPGRRVPHEHFPHGRPHINTFKEHWKGLEHVVCRCP